MNRNAGPHANPMRDTALRWLRHLWASPCTALGLALGLFVLCVGGDVRRVGRTLEFFVHAATVPGRSGPWRPPFAAITFGHVIIGISGARLAELRGHEAIHVRQYETWGPFFLLAYPLASLWAMLRGRCAYRGNFFEQQAFNAESSTRSAA